MRKVARARPSADLLLQDKWLQDVRRCVFFSFCFSNLFSSKCHIIEQGELMERGQSAVRQRILQVLRAAPRLSLSLIHI